MTENPTPPTLAAAGRSLWQAVATAYVLDASELVVLREAARTVDVLDELAELVAVDGVLAESSQGKRAHPALVEARQQRLALARLLAALRIPTSEEDEDSRRPQRRGGPRGFYNVAGAP